MRSVLLMSASLTLGSWVAAAAEPPKPPSGDIPDIAVVNPPFLCADCDAPFDTVTHKKLLDKLVSSPFVSEFRKGLYYQDILHQFESKAHFDNCDFDAAMDYIDELLANTDKHVEAAQAAKSANDFGKMHTSARSAFLSLGQAIHGVQDFYAHTNYIELVAPKTKNLVEFEIVVPWRPAGRERVKSLQGQGLISGYVFWGFPQKCPPNPLSHHDLAKDSADTKGGKEVVVHLQNTTQYRIAAFLAREASVKFMTDAYRRWPFLKELTASFMPVDQLIDRRGLDESPSP